MTIKELIEKFGEEHFIDSHTVQDPEGYKREDNSKVIYHKWEVEPCFVCERQLRSDTVKYMVHYLNNGLITDLGTDELGEELTQKLSQGYYAVGSECRKRIPKRFILKVNGGFH